MSDTEYDTAAERHEAEAEEANQAAIDAREDQGGESHEEYLERVASVPGLFGNLTAAEVLDPSPTPGRENVAEIDEDSALGIDARVSESAVEETREEYVERVTNVPGIFGDIDTSLPEEPPIPTSRAVESGRAQAEADAQAEEEDKPPVEPDVTARQADVEADLTPSTEEIQEQISGESEDDTPAAEEPTQEQAEGQTPDPEGQQDPPEGAVPDEETEAGDLIEQVRASEDYEFVRAQTENSRVTVARAANKRLQELEENS